MLSFSLPLGVKSLNLKVQLVCVCVRTNQLSYSLNLVIWCCLVCFSPAMFYRQRCYLTNDRTMSIPKNSCKDHSHWFVLAFLPTLLSHCCASLVCTQLSQFLVCCSQIDIQLSSYLR